MSNRTTAAAAYVEEREPDPVPEEPLDVRLHEFGRILSEPANATSDPREMIDLPGFQPAVDALSDDLVPIETLRHYVSGENWPLACAAFVALGRHPDRAQLATHVLAHLDELRPWTLFFALGYLAGLDNPPPVGAAAARARDYWIPNPVVREMFANISTVARPMALHPTGATASRIRAAISATLRRSSASSTTRLLQYCWTVCEIGSDTAWTRTSSRRSDDLAGGPGR